MTKTSVFAGIVAAAFALSCGPSNSGPVTGAKTPVIDNVAESAHDLFPLTEGNDWTYSSQRRQSFPGRPSQTDVSDRVLMVTKVTETGQGTDAEIEVTGEDAADTLLLLYRITDDGIYQLGHRRGDDKLMYSEPFLLLPWPIKEGETFSWEGNGPLLGTGAVGPMKTTVLVRGYIEVDTHTDRYKACRVEVTETYTFDDVEYNTAKVFWFAPRVGLVRYNESVRADTGAAHEALLELTSHTIK